MRNKKIKQDFDNAGLIVQVVLMINLLFFGVISYFEESFSVLTTSILTMLLLIMAYNNKNVYKRRGFTAIYLGVSFVTFVAVIITLIYG